MKDSIEESEQIVLEGHTYRALTLRERLQAIQDKNYAQDFLLSIIARKDEEIRNLMLRMERAENRVYELYVELDKNGIFMPCECEEDDESEEIELPETFEHPF